MTAVAWVAVAVIAIVAGILIYRSLDPERIARRKGKGRLPK